MPENDAIGRILVILLALILANGFFSGSEMAIVSARRSRLEAQAKAGRRAARQALQLADNPDHALAIVQVGITLIGTFSAAYGGARLADALALRMLARWPGQLGRGTAEELALILVVLLVTYLSLVLGELVPKQIGLQRAERWAIFAAPIMLALARLTNPIVRVLTWSVNLILRLLGQQGGHGSRLSQADIEHLIREGQQSGAVEPEEAALIARVFRFTDRPVRAVMTPRTQVVALDLATPVSKAAQTFVDTGFSRLPVYEGGAENIVGILHARDLVRGLLPGEPVDLRAILRPVTFLIETDRTDEALTRLGQSGTHLAIVIDEYGQMAGLLTLEDLLEELVGEIRDEYDPPEAPDIVRREDGSWLVDGMTDYERVAAELGMPAPESEEALDYTTLAGHILARLGHLPKVGERLRIDDFDLEIVDMDGRRIDRVLVSRR